MSGPAPAAALFRDEPARWGLRGDPWIWREMRERFERVACPTTPEAVAALVGDAFAELTGVPLSHPEPVYVARYDHGGMSGGHVDPRFWRETALPLVHGRLRDPLSSGS